MISFLKSYALYVNIFKIVKTVGETRALCKCHCYTNIYYN
jgi:hypothetical protein